MARFKVTIDHTKVSANLTDFPVYIDLSDMPSAFWDVVADDDGSPSGSYIASGTVAPPTGAQWVDVTTGSSFNLTAGTQYWIVVQYESGTVSASDRWALVGLGASSANDAITYTRYPATGIEGNLGLFIGGSGLGSISNVQKFPMFIIGDSFGQPYVNVVSGAIYNSTDTKWDVIAVAEEAV